MTEPFPPTLASIESVCETPVADLLLTTDAHLADTFTELTTVIVVCLLSSTYTAL